MPLSVLGGLGLTRCPLGPVCPVPQGWRLCPDLSTPQMPLGVSPWPLSGLPVTWLLFQSFLGSAVLSHPCWVVLSPPSLAFGLTHPLDPGPCFRPPARLSVRPAVSPALCRPPGGLLASVSGRERTGPHQARSQCGLTLLQTDRLGPQWPGLRAVELGAGQVISGMCGQSGSACGGAAARFCQDRSQAWRVTPFCAWQPACHPAHDRPLPPREAPAQAPPPLCPGLPRFSGLRLTGLPSWGLLGGS